MLSAKARAFSVESLLAKKKEEADENPERKDQIHLRYPLLQVGHTSLPAFQYMINGSGVKQQIKVELYQNELWESFHRLGTEMIVTKTGRRMFPTLRIKVNGLDPSGLYRVSVTFRPVDKLKYRYIYHSSKWMVAGNGDSMIPNQSYEYPVWPLTGATLMNQVTSFEKIKLTNSEKPKIDQISLVSMQKYRPCIHITALGDNSKNYEDMTAEFSQTTFMAVTAYQNQEITRLKIARNPFAKGFREVNKHRSSLETMLSTLGVFQAIDKPRKRIRSNFFCSQQAKTSLSKCLANRIIPEWCSTAQKTSILKPKTQIITKFDNHTNPAELKSFNCFSRPTSFVIHNVSQPPTFPSCVIASTFPQERLQPFHYHLAPLSVHDNDKSQTNLTHTTNNGIHVSSVNRTDPHLTFEHMMFPQPTHLTNNISSHFSGKDDAKSL